MHQSKLISLLRTFRARDFRRFRAYLASPYFNKRQDLVEFYAAIEQFAPDFTEAECSREKLWRAYAPEMPLDEKALTYLANFLLKQAESYISTEAFQQDESSKGSRFLSYCLEHGLDKHYRAAHLGTRKSLQQEDYRDAEWQLKAWRLADAEMQHFYSSRSRKAPGSIQRVVDHLDAFYLDKKLELGSELLNLNQILQTEFDTAFIDELVGMVDQRGKVEPSVAIRRLVLNILRDPQDSDSFHSLLQMLPQTHRYFPPEKVKGIFAYAQNYCIRRIKAGDKQFEMQLFHIYQESIQSKLIYENGLLSPWDFKNVCSIALRLGEYQWTQDFITEHESRIAIHFRASAIAYNSANLFFHQGQFDTALRTLMQVEFSDIFYALDTRRMMLMIYFERGDTDALLSLVASFRAYLNRNKFISAQNKSAYKAFVDWAARIYRFSASELQNQREALLREIRETHPLVAQEWLLTQLKDE